MPLIGIVFWSTVSAAAWANTRIAGDVVLDVPLDPTIGPLSYARSGLVIPHAEALVTGCDCGTEDKREEAADPVLVPVDEACTVHGITAVNELDARGCSAWACMDGAAGRACPGFRSRPRIRSMPRTMATVRGGPSNSTIAARAAFAGATKSTW
ncbi:hypothetical protein GCM10023166_35350 [Paeniglutamicibacter cryotolerans]